MEKKNITAGSVTPEDGVTSDKSDTRVVRVNVTDIDRIMEGGYADEKPATVLHRLLDEVDELRQGKSDHTSNAIQIDTLHDRITELEEENDELRSGSSTAVIPGQQTFSIKDAVDSLKGVCDDDAVCLKFAAKMLETQAAATNSSLERGHRAEQQRLDREHRAEQQSLDREEKKKERAFKKELAESRAGHDKDLTMIKKGMIKESDLEDIVFLGQKNMSPADRIKNKKEIAARVAASEEEEFGDVDPPEMGI